MNLRQLKTLCEIVDHGLRASDAAYATHRSQSSVTRQIQFLEKELGVELFARRRNKLLGMTPYGEEILTIARRVIQDVENMRRIGKNAAGDERGEVTIATTNFQAKYVLPPTIRRFIKRYPDVKLSLRHGSPAECCNLVMLGKADFAISSAVDVPEGLAAIPCYRFYRSVLTPLQHPLLKVKPLTLRALASYPLITYDEAFSGSFLVNKTFSDQGLQPKILLSVVDADISKNYVGMGLGIAICASVAFDPKQDSNLRRIDARHLFKPGELSVIFRRRTHLQSYMFDFLQMFAPHVDRALIEDALFKKRVSHISHGTLPDL